MKFLLVCVLLSVAVSQGDPVRYARRLPAVRARRPMDAVVLTPKGSQQDETKSGWRRPHHRRQRGGAGPVPVAGGRQAGRSRLLRRLPHHAPLRPHRGPLRRRTPYHPFVHPGEQVIMKDHLKSLASNLRVTTFTISLGTLSSAANAEGALTLTSTHGIVHPDYWTDASTTDNDVAIVHLPEMVMPTDTIKTVRLPSASQVGESFVGRTVTLSGWGLVSDDSETVSPTLQFVDLTIISNEECEEAFPGAISNDHICTKGATNESPCNGDSGGPLVIKEDDGEYTEIGVVSFGSDYGCSLGYPGAFARVTTYLDWINENSVHDGH